MNTFAARRCAGEIPLGELQFAKNGRDDLGGGEKEGGDEKYKTSKEKGEKRAHAMP